MSEKPAGADIPEGTVGSPVSPVSPVSQMSSMSGWASGSVSDVWQSSPPGSIYDYIRVASFSLGSDGRIV